MGTLRHRRHSTELKLRLVQMHLYGEASLHGLAREHEISRNLIRLWVDKFQKGELSEEPDKSATINNELKVLTCIFKFGIEFGYLADAEDQAAEFADQECAFPLRRSGGRDSLVCGAESSSDDSIPNLYGSARGGNGPSGMDRY